MLCNCGLFKTQHIFKAGFIRLFTERLGETRQPWEGMHQAASWPGVKPHFPLFVSAMGCCSIQATVSRDGVSQQDGVMVCVHVRAQAEAQMSTEVLLASPVAKYFTC